MDYSYNNAPASAPGQLPMPSQGIPFEARPDQGFIDWLVNRSGGALAFTTYQAGVLALFSWTGKQVSVFLRRFPKVMGLDADADRLLLATRNDLMVFGNSKVLANNFREPGRYDALYLPRASYHYPDISVHDCAFGKDGIWFVNTRFSVLCHPSDTHTFEPVWRPPFVDDLAPEDRCHLNGLAMRDGEPAFVTALGRTNTAGGWRDNKVSGGIVLHVPCGDIVADGLAMPHSPRWHAGRLYVLNSGAGELLCINPDSGSRDIVCRLQGYLRGLSFAGQYAIVGLCQIREERVFGGMPVQEVYDKLLCGIAIVDLISGKQVGFLEIISGCTEIFDVRVLTGQQRPAVLNLEQPDINDAISVPGAYYWLRPENEIKD
jgi:uncharacterized protein (TIGR03032 family)